MGDFMIWFWLVIFVLTIIIEFITVDFVSIWFSLAAIPTMIIAIFDPYNIWLQVIVFFITGFILLALTRPLVVRYFKKNIVTTNVDAYVGKNAIVIKEISDDQPGLVDFDHMNWTAISSETIHVGDRVRILAIEGNKFIVTKIEQTNLNK